METSKRHLHDNLHICPYCELCDECHGSGWIGCCENTGRSCSSCNKTGRVDVGYSKAFVDKLNQKLVIFMATHDLDAVVSATLTIGFSSYYSVLAKTRDEERRLMRESIKTSVDSVRTMLSSLEVIKVHGRHIDVKGKMSDLIEAICLSSVIYARQT